MDRTQKNFPIFQSTADHARTTKQIQMIKWLSDVRDRRFGRRSIQVIANRLNIGEWGFEILTGVREGISRQAITRGFFCKPRRRPPKKACKPIGPALPTAGKALRR